jgi:uncharacterized protein
MFNTAFWYMTALTAIMSVVVFVKQKSQLAESFKLGGKMFVDILPLLVVSFILAGLIQSLIPKEALSRWLGKEAGLKGVMYGCLAGALAPGAPYISFPIIASFYKAGASLGATIGFITSWSLWQVYRIPLEISIIGFRVAMIRFLSTLIFPPLAGILVHYLVKK